ncbi:MAG TPA: cation-transporting P-type ATPase [Egicoccus sp.]|nr:cation-transporting P-type ATPase [Egicoccus sp.]HSK24122.1 cation-transporting P-type ATPase [Egicoccus sp.]
MKPETTTAPALDRPRVEDPHTRGVAEVAAALDVDLERGLDEATVRERRAATGPNELVSEPPPSLLSRFVAQFRSLLILVLVGAAALSAVVGDLKDAVVVGVVLLINAVLGTVQEARAEQSVRALNDLLPSRARVRRDGRTVEVPAAELVVGDVVLVEAGDRVPADGRVVLDAVLAADESSLTGETTAATKHAADLTEPDAPVADRTNMLWMNTTVVRGRGELVVTGTGMDTRIGQVAQLLSDAPDRKTPLQRQIDDLARRLALVALVAVLAVFAIALLRGDTLATAALDAIALAIAAIPEGLPAVVTITLALGTRAMARQRAIVKRLTSVETLGSTQVICTDKTGTLTRNEMTVRTIVVGEIRHEVSGDGYDARGDIHPPLPDTVRGLHAMVLCNDADVRDGRIVGDPTEAALLVLAAKAGVDIDAVRRRGRLAEVPFDAATKLMATLHAVEEDRPGTLVAVKGAPDVVLGRCDRFATADGPAPLEDHHRDAVSAQISALASEGLRTLAIATRELDRHPGEVDDPEAELDLLVFEFLVGIVDPPRDGVADAIGVAHAAGIRVMMVTGDHPDTAAAIARTIGIPGEVVTGADLDALDDDTLAVRVEELGVCARVAPEHKVRLVSALQANGRTTAMTGDGVNDAAALKRADIGVAMGITGTEVTKEAGDLVLADDDFATIVTAVEQGRGIYDNIVSFVRFQLATNIGAIVAILGARLLGLPAPFTPIQVLWVNLIMDGPPALALGADPAAPDVMGRRPRDPDAPILDGARLRRLLLTGAVMGGGTIAVFRWALGTGDSAFATTLAFTTFVFFQFFNAVNARLEFDSVFTRHTLRNGKLWAALAGVLALQVLAVQVPAVGGLVDVVPLGWRHWLLAAGVAASLLVVEEVRKLLTRLRH